MSGRRVPLMVMGSADAYDWYRRHPDPEDREVAPPPPVESRPMLSRFGKVIGTTVRQTAMAPINALKRGALKVDEAIGEFLDEVDQAKAQAEEDAARRADAERRQRQRDALARREAAEEQLEAALRERGRRMIEQAVRRDGIWQPNHERNRW